MVRVCRLSATTFHLVFQLAYVPICTQLYTSFFVISKISVHFFFAVLLLFSESFLSGTLLGITSCSSFSFSIPFSLSFLLALCLFIDRVIPIFFSHSLTRAHRSLQISFWKNFNYLSRNLVAIFCALELDRPFSFSKFTTSSANRPLDISICLLL